jgi:tetratricopeptide (TPR) repeat protein
VALLVPPACGAPARPHDDRIYERLSAEEAALRRAGPDVPPPLNAAILRDLARAELVRAFGESWTAIQENPELLVMELTRALMAARVGGDAGGVPPEMPATVHLSYGGWSVAFEVDIKKIRTDLGKRAEAHLLRGLARLAFSSLVTGGSEGALNDFEEVLRAEPRNAPALVGRGLYRLERGMAGKAQEDLTASVQVDPGNPHARMVLSLAQFRLRQFGAAVASAEEALSLTPADDARRVFIQDWIASVRERKEE